MDATTALGSERANVLAALKSAAASTGSDFHYLLGTAMRESSLRPDAQSGSSSAAGLFQFVDQTWLGLVKDHGAQYGLAPEAALISKGDDGRFHVADGKRDAILDLRKNPQLSALMAGEYARTTSASMASALGRPVCGGELYAAHFLGPDAACRLIRLTQSDPTASAAREFPQAAGANRNVFFHADGSAKSVKDVYDWALRQPGEGGTMRITPAPDASSLLLAGTASDSNIQELLAGVMNWQPRGDFFSAATPGGGALSFSPGLLNLLSGSSES